MLKNDILKQSYKNIWRGGVSDFFVFITLHVFRFRVIFCKPGAFMMEHETREEFSNRGNLKDFICFAGKKHGF